jgi:hypothetical protein
MIRSLSPAKDITPHHVHNDKGIFAHTIIIKEGMDFAAFQDHHQKGDTLVSVERVIPSLHPHISPHAHIKPAQLRHNEHPPWYETCYIISNNGIMPQRGRLLEGNIYTSPQTKSSPVLLSCVMVFSINIIRWHSFSTSVRLMIHAYIIY